MGRERRRRRKKREVKKKRRKKREKGKEEKGGKKGRHRRDSRRRSRAGRGVDEKRCARETRRIGNVQAMIDVGVGMEIGFSVGATNRRTRFELSDERILKLIFSE